MNVGNQLNIEKKWSHVFLLLLLYLRQDYTVWVRLLIFTTALSKRIQSLKHAQTVSELFLESELCCLDVFISTPNCSIARLQNARIGEKLILKSFRLRILWFYYSIVQRKQNEFRKKVYRKYVNCVSANSVTQTDCDCTDAQPPKMSFIKFVHKLRLKSLHIHKQNVTIE